MQEPDDIFALGCAIIYRPARKSSDLYFRHNAIFIFAYFSIVIISQYEQKLYIFHVSYPLYTPKFSVFSCELLDIVTSGGPGSSTWHCLRLSVSHYLFLPISNCARES